MPNVWSDQSVAWEKYQTARKKFVANCIRLRAELPVRLSLEAENLLTLERAFKKAQRRVEKLERSHG